MIFWWYDIFTSKEKSVNENDREVICRHVQEMKFIAPHSTVKYTFEYYWNEGIYWYIDPFDVNEFDFDVLMVRVYLDSWLGRVAQMQPSYQDDRHSSKVDMLMKLLGGLYD